MHGSTFGGGPLVCAAALEFLTVIEDDRSARQRSRHAARNFAPVSKSSPRDFDFIREIRGEGLILGLDLSIEGAPFVEEGLRDGLLINCTHDHILRLLPPFIIRRRMWPNF